MKKARAGITGDTWQRLTAPAPRTDSDHGRQAEKISRSRAAGDLHAADVVIICNNRNVSSRPRPLAPVPKIRDAPPSLQLEAKISKATGQVALPLT